MACARRSWWSNRSPSKLGEHTEEVLEEWLGMDADEIENLRGQGVI